MPIRFTVENRPAGFACSNARGGDVARIMVKGALTSDEPQFHRFMEEMEKWFLWRAGVPLDDLHSFVIVFHDDLTADLYVNEEVVVLAEVRSKRDLVGGEVVAQSDLLDVRRLVFPTIELVPSDQVVFCGKFAWKFALYFDHRADGQLDSDVVARDLARLYRDLHYEHLYASISNQPLFTALRDDGWFPFAEIIGSEYRDLVRAYAEGFERDARVEAIVDRFTPERIQQITERWWTSKVFADKRAILSAGVEAYVRGDAEGFVQCIKTLITEPEGVLRHHYKAATGKGNYVKTPELAEHAATEGARVSGHDESLLLPAEFRAYLEEVVFRNFNLDTGDLAPSRNTVGHGVARPEDYTRARALQAILILDHLRFLLGDGSRGTWGSVGTKQPS